MAVFYSHVEKALRAKATGPVAGGRLQGDAPVTLAALGNPAVTRPTGAPYELFGPGDVERLAAGAITRRFPAPGASDAEEKKLALVEFGAPSGCTPGSCSWSVGAPRTMWSCGRTAG